MALWKGLTGHQCDLIYFFCINIFFSCVALENTHMIKEREEIWRSYKFENVGVKLQAPDDIQWTERLYGEDPSLYIEFAPVVPPKGVLDDTYYLVKITITRITKKRLYEKSEEYTTSGLYERSSSIQRKRWLWGLDIHPKIEQFSSGDFSYYRKDLLIDEDEILSAKIELTNSGLNLERREQYDKTIIRILDSIEAL